MVAYLEGEIPSLRASVHSRVMITRTCFFAMATSNSFNKLAHSIRLRLGRQVLFQDSADCAGPVEFQSSQVIAVAESGVPTDRT